MRAQVAADNATGDQRVGGLGTVPAIEDHAAVDIPTILINLDRSTDRFARMQAEFARVRLGFERFPAVDGKNLPASVRPYFCDASGEVRSLLRAGEVGCYASHLAIWQRVAAGDYGPGPVLVCEDDLALSDDLPLLLQQAVARAPAGWDIIRLSCVTERPVVPVASLAGQRVMVQFTRGPSNTGAYLITVRGATKLLRDIGVRNLPVDRDLMRPWQFDLRELGVLPAPVEPNIGVSVIDSMAGRDRDRSLLRRTCDRWQRLAFNVKTLGLRQLVLARRRFGAHMRARHF